MQPSTNATVDVRVVNVMLIPTSSIVSAMRSTGSVTSKESPAVRLYEPKTTNASSRPMPKITWSKETKIE